MLFRSMRILRVHLLGFVVRIYQDEKRLLTLIILNTGKDDQSTRGAVNGLWKCGVLQNQPQRENKDQTDLIFCLLFYRRKKYETSGLSEKKEVNTTLSKKKK